MLEIVHGEVIDAARADLWAPGLGQVDTRSSARNPKSPPSGWIRTDGRLNWALICGMKTSECVSNISCGFFPRISSPGARASFWSGATGRELNGMRNDSGRELWG